MHLAIINSSSKGKSLKIIIRCPHCGGQGETITKHCHVCHGKKLEESYEKNTLYIERGTVPGEEILVEEGYDEHLDGETADIRFVVSAIPDRVFKMEGHNLKAYIDLTLEEALLGFKRRFEHIDGEILDISNNNPYNPSITTRITHPNQIIKIPGKGMYKEKYSDQQGDLILVARVHLPQKLTAEQIERIVRSNIYSVGKILLPRRLSLIIVYYHKFLSSFLISYNFVDRKK